MLRIYDKCRRREPLSREEAYRLYDEAPLQELALVADEVRRAVVPDPQVVTWQIDRNVNITNVCISGCKFCNFHCKPHQTDRAFITTMEQYCEKIDRTLRLGGDQLLLQGGLHPGLKIDFYERLFSGLKSRYPSLRLHALGAPEVAHIARISGLTTLETLRRLMAAGLDSLPGAGAEILDSDVRRAISPAKPSVEKWLDVMHEAHCLNLPTSATMMYGHVETPHQRIDHLLRIRDLQTRCPEGNYGGVLQLVERLEVVGPRDADRRAVVAVAPRHIILILDLGYAGIVTVNPLGDFGIGAHEFEILLADIPLDAVHRESGVDAHAAVGVVAAENARIIILAFLEGNDRRVENAVRRRKRVARDDRIGRIAPHHFFGAGGTILPRHIGLIRARNFQCIHINYLSFGLSPMKFLKIRQ